jgi:hypothetical protein
VLSVYKKYSGSAIRAEIFARPLVGLVFGDILFSLSYGVLFGRDYNPSAVVGSLQFSAVTAMTFNYRLDR